MRRSRFDLVMRRFGNLIIACCFLSCAQENKSHSKAVSSKTQKEENANSEIPKFHKGHNLWTGSVVKNNIQYVCGIEFDNLDSLNIEYRLTCLEDWVLKKELYGEAQHIFSLSKNSEIIAYKDTFDVFYFLDTTNNVRILFSKNEGHSPMLAKVQYNKYGNWTDTTMVMHQK